MSATVLGPKGDEVTKQARAFVPPGDLFLPLTQILRFVRTYDDEGNIESSDLRPAEEFRVALTFRDTAGRIWRRDEYGALMKIGDTVYIDRAERRYSVGAPRVVWGSDEGQQQVAPDRPGPA